MAAAASSSTNGYRAQMVETLEDGVSGDLMTQAVTLIPCGHVFNEDTVIQILARNKLCPNDRTPIQRYIPNYTIRALAQTTSTHPEEVAQPREEEPTEEAYAHFARAKAMSDQNNYEGGIACLLQALQISPHFQKAQAYLDFCLAHAAEKESVSSPLSSSPTTQGNKEKYTSLLLNLIEQPQIQADRALEAILGTAIENLIEGTAPQLTAEEETQYKWAQQLLGEDRKVRSFIAKKLHAIHGEEPSSQFTSRPAPSAPPEDFFYDAVSSLARPATVACSLSSAPALPPQAFGKAKWLQYFGDIGEEPPLPPDIHQILQSPCPFWPDKKVAETHMLVLLPKTVNGAPLTLNTLGELVKHPKQGNATQYEQKYCWEDIFTTLGAQSLPNSAWVLMTKDVLFGSRSKTYADQCKIVENYREQTSIPYQVPDLLEATICIFLEYVQSGRHLYSREPLTYTRCQNKLQGHQLAVGGFAAAGLFVSRSRSGRGDVSVGVGCVRKF